MRRQITLLLLVLALLAGACSGDDDDGADDAPDDVPTVPSSGGVPGQADRAAGPVSVRLSQGERSGPAVVEVAPYVEGVPLDAGAVDTVVARLPEWSGTEGEQVDFNRPAESLPPPVSGDIIDVPFPVGGGDPPPVVDDGPLTVLRHQPEGKVGLAPFVSLTFSQPMIALGTVAQTDEAGVPVTITPEMPGRWQWIGTRTLRFEHDQEIFDRLPMATTYSVVVPAGTASASGDVLDAEYRFGFETPSPTVQWLTPTHDSLPLEPIFYVVFDQRIDPDAVLAVTTLTLGGQPVELRLASTNEIADDEFVSAQSARALEGTWVAFRAVDPLTPDSAIEIEIGPEIPSIEGPNTTDQVFTEQARTYAPLRVENQSCRPSDDCQPEWGFSVSFNNELDAESIDPADLTFDPELPGAYIRTRCRRDHRVPRRRRIPVPQLRRGWPRHPRPAGRITDTAPAVAEPPRGAGARLCCRSVRVGGVRDLPRDALGRGRPLRPTVDRDLRRRPAHRGAGERTFRGPYRPGARVRRRPGNGGRHHRRGRRAGRSVA
jgi:hypothetical protein